MERKKGMLNETAGSLEQDVIEVQKLSSEKVSVESAVTHTIMCDAFFTIYCC